MFEDALGAFQCLAPRQHGHVVGGTVGQDETQLVECRQLSESTACLDVAIGQSVGSAHSEKADEDSLATVFATVHPSLELVVDVRDLGDQGVGGESCRASLGDLDLLREQLLQISQAGGEALGIGFVQVGKAVQGRCFRRRVL